jgi:CHAT domain-containing protein
VLSFVYGKLKTLKMIRLIVLIFLVHMSYPEAHAQINKPGVQDSSYDIYKEQIYQLLIGRGVPPQEVKEMLTTLKVNNLTSDENLADMLGKLYSAKRNIAILFYFFNGGKLKTVLFEPGRIVERKVATISKEQLLQIGVDLNHALGLYSTGKKRAPVKRGVTDDIPTASSNIKYTAIINKATELLIPKSFTRKYQHLLIIPAVNISTIPFYLLTPYGDSTQIIDQCSITVIPGLIDLITLRMRALKSVTTWMGLDMPVAFDKNSDFLDVDSLAFQFDNVLFISNPAYPKDSSFIFPDLPGAKKEVSNALKYANDYRLLEGKHARKDSVLKYLNSSRIAYFATHGIADAVQPMEKSFLVLSGPNPYLTARNIMDHRQVMINSTTQQRSFPEMIILSACQTGLGKSVEAGVIGLARTFLLAGSKHVIMSLWNVDDEATAYLMRRFIHHLHKRLRFTPSEPLRLAMLDTRKKYPKPSQWASFSLFGIDY